MNTILNGATTVGATGTPMSGQYVNKMSIQGYVVGAGAVSATIIVEGSNNGTDWVPISSLTMSDNGRAIDGGVLSTLFSTIRARVAAISGTGAAATVEVLWRQ